MFNYHNLYHIGWFGDPGQYGTAKNTAIRPYIWQFGRFEINLGESAVKVVSSAEMHLYLAE